MRTPKILITAAAIGAGALAAAGPAAAAPSTLAQEARPFPLTASQGVVAWSSWDEQARVYRLVALRDGRRTVLPVPGSPEPFDVDLGTDRKGRLVAVYSRHTDGAQQDLYRFSFASAKETLLASLSRPDTHERQPTVWRGDIAFVRESAKTTRLMLGNTTRSGAPRTLVSRPVRNQLITQPELTLTPPRRNGAIAPRRLVAYMLTSIEEQNSHREVVHVRAVRTEQDKAIELAPPGGAHHGRLTAPAWSDDGRALYFARTNHSSAQGNRSVRYLPASGRVGYAPGLSDVFSTAWQGGVHTGSLLFSTPDTSDCGSAMWPGVCKLQSTGPLTFSARP